MSVFFVTASGTDVGKTFITSLLLLQMRREGLEGSSAIKPIVTGVGSDNFADSVRLLRACGYEQDTITEEMVDKISPWRFREAISPHIAANREGRELRVSDVVAFCKGEMTEYSDSDDKHLFIEGIGGIMVPINSRETVLDWMKCLNIPIILVVGNYLGSINHSLMTIDIIGKEGLNLHTIFVSESEGGVCFDETIDTIGKFCDPSVNRSVNIIGIRRRSGYSDMKELAETINDITYIF